MKLLADENIAAPLVAELREEGIDTSYVAELASGITDDEVLEVARSEGRLLLTEDKDFGELVFRIKRHLPGIILLRLPIEPRGQEEQRERVREVLRREAGKLNGHYTVIGQHRVRIRPMPK